MSQIDSVPEEDQTQVRLAEDNTTSKLTPISGDHVDILGRSSLNDLILKVAGGQGESIPDHVVSNIKEYAEKVKIYDD